jgi:L-lactate utilization protein LutB
MLTEECGFRHYMASVGIEVIETDLGERIQQLDNEDPSHVVVPAVHKLRTDVAEVFAQFVFNVVDHDLPPGTAMVAPRFHAQNFPDSLLPEARRRQCVRSRARQARSGRRPDSGPLSAVTLF